MTGFNPKVDFYFNKSAKWQDEIGLLRTMALDCQLTEVLKWGCPCYTHDDVNIVLIHTFKDYCALLFFKGSLMPDPEGILIQQTKNVQAGRQIRFTGLREVSGMETVVKSYIRAAIAVEKSGQKVVYKATGDLIFPEEFIDKMDEIPELKTAFDALSPGRQRGYNLYFSAAKQPKTRLSRIEKYLPNILAGKGMDD